MHDFIFTVRGLEIKIQGSSRGDELTILLLKIWVDKIVQNLWKFRCQSMHANMPNFMFALWDWSRHISARLADIITGLAHIYRSCLGTTTQYWLLHNYTTYFKLSRFIIMSSLKTFFLQILSSDVSRKYWLHVFLPPFSILFNVRFVSSIQL